MATKTRAAAGKGSRGGGAGGRKAAKPARQGMRNITRWSANKDITLLCAFAKECRRDKFAPPWERIARWIGPNITGAAVEQHISKLYSKLVNHRKATEPKPKKKKSGRYEEEGQADYANDEEDWGKGNEALANIFYDKPDVTAMNLVQDDDDSDGDGDFADEMNLTSRKRSGFGRHMLFPGNDDEDDHEYLTGNPDELFGGGTKYFATDMKGADDGTTYGVNGSEIATLKREPVNMAIANIPYQGSPLMMDNGNPYNLSDNLAGVNTWSPHHERGAYIASPAIVPSPASVHHSLQSPLLQNPLLLQKMASPIMQGGNGLQGGYGGYSAAMNMQAGNVQLKRHDHILASASDFNGQLPGSQRQTMTAPAGNWQNHSSMGSSNMMAGDLHRKLLIPNQGVVSRLLGNETEAIFRYGSPLVSPNPASNLQLPAHPGSSRGHQHQLAYRPKSRQSSKSNEGQALPQTLMQRSASTPPPFAPADAFTDGGLAEWTNDDSFGDEVHFNTDA